MPRIATKHLRLPTTISIKTSTALLSYRRLSPIPPVMAPPPTNEIKLKDAKALQKSDPSKSESIYKDILSRPVSSSSEAALRDYESALIGLGELYRDNKKAQELAKLIETSRGTLSSFAKAKTAKLGELKTKSYIACH